MTEEEEKALIERYIDAYNRFDVEAMVACVHPQVVFRNVTGGAVNAEAIGADQFRELALQSKALFSSRKQTVTRAEFSGGTATVDIAYEAVLAVDLPGGMKAGQRLALSGQSQFAFADGKISKITDSS